MSYNFAKFFLRNVVFNGFLCAFFHLDLPHVSAARIPPLYTEDHPTFSSFSLINLSGLTVVVSSFPFRGQYEGKGLVVPAKASILQGKSC